ncbi:LCP family protein [Candidatus Woesebacteria bacterium]|nr:LCP family protein [Candidatus Woesebacteria bacterium]
MATNQQPEMKQSRLARVKERNKKIKQVSIALGLLIVMIGGLFVLRMLGFYKSIQTEAQTNKPKKEDIHTHNFLLLGYGGGNHAGAFLTDTIMLAHVDTKKKKILLISIPRDIWVEVPTKDDTFHSKINAVYQMGLFPENYPALDPKFHSNSNPSGYINYVVKNLAGLEVDGYVAVDFEGFVQTVGELGGIDVAVEKEFYDYEYPITGKEDDVCDLEGDQLEEALRIATTSSVLEAFPCRFETLHFVAGTTHMDGEEALKFARSRHSLQDGGDFNRTRRQQLVLEAMKEKVLQIGFIPKIIPLLDQLETHISTDIPLADLQSLLLEARNAKQYSVETFVVGEDYLSSDYSNEGQYITIPKVGLDDWSEVKLVIHQIIEGITPTPTPSLTSSPSPTSTP